MTNHTVDKTMLLTSSLMLSPTWELSQLGESEILLILSVEYNIYAYFDY